MQKNVHVINIYLPMGQIDVGVKCIRLHDLNDLITT